jgi:Co/Zn/Cd efflux system component
LGGINMRKIEDERIIAEKRKINSSAFGICFLGLWGILLYRQFVLNQEITEYMDVFFLTIGISIYVTINNVFKGHYLTYRNKNEKKKINFISAAVGSVTFIIVQFFVMKYSITDVKDILSIVLSFIVFFVVWIVFQMVLLKISEKKANEDTE